MPLARATGMGSTFDCADHSNSVCFLVRSTISWPVMVGFVIAVVIVPLSNFLFTTESQGHRENYKTLLIIPWVSSGALKLIRRPTLIPDSFIYVSSCA